MLFAGDGEFCFAAVVVVMILTKLTIVRRLTLWSEDELRHGDNELRRV